MDKAKSYSDYLAEQAEKHGDLSAKPVRRPNEGSEADKKWANAKELKRDDNGAEYIKGKEEKTKPGKQRKEKTYVDVDTRFIEPPRSSGSGRGGRGATRDGPRGGGRGRGRGRGGGGRGGGRGGGQAAGPTVDEYNFPSLGSR